MQENIKTISLPLPLRMGRVNCYLIENSSGYVLIDTGGVNNRTELASELEKCGCKPGLLKLIVITHGDFDHSGNAAYLRNSYGSKVALHREDAGMVEQGDMFVNRKNPNPIIRMLLPLFSRFGRSERFAPDILLKDGDDLSEYGFYARVISIPGHSKGSIGILLAGGDLFCGDLLDNTKKPVLNSLMDDLVSAQTSIQKLKSLNISTVYPGHGKPFPMQLFWGESNQAAQ